VKAPRPHRHALVAKEIVDLGEIKIRASVSETSSPSKRISP
jgi:hypothetical protein